VNLNRCHYPVAPFSKVGGGKGREISIDIRGFALRGVLGPFAGVETVCDLVANRIFASLTTI